MKVTLLLCLVLTGSYAVNQETFRGRLNPQGTQTGMVFEEPKL